MKNVGSFVALSLVGLVGCGQQEPAAAPLAPPPPAAPVAVAAPPVEMKKEEPKPVPLTPEQKVKGYQDAWAAFNAKDFAKFQTVWADDATGEQLDMGPPYSGAATVVERGAKQFAAGFPDGTGELELTLVNGNTVLSIVLLRGTQTGPYLTPMGEVPATGKKVGFLAAHSVELNEVGKATKEIMAFDGGTVAGQLGLMPLPHRKVIESGWTDKPVVVASGSDAEKANLAAFSAELDGFNKHDPAAALGVAADDIVFSELTAPADRTGKKEAQKGIEEMFKAFPDAKLDVKNSWAAGDYVVAIGSWSGTNTGDMGKMKKTGKPVVSQFVEVDKFAAGKTKNIWIFSNGAAVAAQLGLIPPKGKPGPEGKGEKGAKGGIGAKEPKPEAKKAAAPAMTAASPAKPAAGAGKLQDRK